MASSIELRNNSLFLRNTFKNEGTFNIPIIQKTILDKSDIKFIGYDHCKQEDRKNKHKFVHFFIDDIKFESLWKNPERRLSILKQYSAILTPQFSNYIEMPTAMQIYNIFRSRWVGAYFQQAGLRVIPTVYWGNPESYWYCFDGIVQGGTVAVSTLGVRKQKDFFMHGYREMIRRLKPKLILCYSTPFKEMDGNIVEINYQETNFKKNYQNNFLTLNQLDLPNKKNIIIKHYGYVTKGMGSSRGGKREYRKPKSGSGKQRASNIPSWAKGERPFKGENGKEFAERLLDERYGEGNYPKGAGTEHNQLHKYGDRGFEK